MEQSPLMVRNAAARSALLNTKSGDSVCIHSGADIFVKNKGDGNWEFQKGSVGSRDTLGTLPHQEALHFVEGFKGFVTGLEETFKGLPVGSSRALSHNPIMLTRDSENGFRIEEISLRTSKPNSTELIKGPMNQVMNYWVGEYMTAVFAIKSGEALKAA